MAALLDHLFAAVAFVPPEGEPIRQPDFLALHAVSDGLIALAHFSIATSLWVFVRRRQDLEFGWIFWLFLAFILATGLSHLATLIALFGSPLGLQELVKATTALLSLATAAVVWVLVPRALALLGNGELRLLNAELLSGIEAERQTGRELRDTLGQIEDRVAARTRDLAAANDRLRAEIEDRERAERHQQMLLAELRHRTRNTLAIVKSIAAQTRQHSDSIDAFSRSFNARVQALADTHTLLFESNWTHSSLDQLIRQHLRPYGGERRAELRGPEVPVRPKAALSLSLVLHELTANAAKYGALSTNHGAIGVEWQREGDAGNERLVIVWREAGGPEVAAPSRRGFGSEVVELTIQLEFNGEAIFDFDPKGLIVNMSLPLTDGEL